MLLRFIGEANRVHASKPCTDVVAGFEAPSALHAGAISFKSQFAPSQDMPAQVPCDVPARTSEDFGPVLDKSGLEELCANLSSAEAREFVWLCIVDTEMRLADIATHRAAGDPKRVAEVAQRIAREAAKLGALRVHVLALRLETECRGGSAGSYALISDLSDAWADVGEALCAWLPQQASPVAA